MKKIYLALAVFVFTLIAPINVNAATKLKTPSFNEKISPVIYKSATYHINKKKGYTYYYTTNGKTPTKKSKKYGKSIKISKSQTLKVIAYKGKDKSKVFTQKFTVQNRFVQPSVKPGTYKSGFTVQFSLADTDKYSYYVVEKSLTGLTEYNRKTVKNGFKISVNYSRCIEVWRKNKNASKDEWSIDDWDYCEEAFYYYVNSAGISAKYASGTYRKPITPSFKTKIPVEDMCYIVECYNKYGDEVDEYLGVIDELPELKSGYTYEITVIVDHKDRSTSSAKQYRYRIK